MTEQSTPIPLGRMNIKSALAHAVALERGVNVGGYELAETLSRGSFGTVWRARRVSDRAPVAIKFLHPFLCESHEAIGRLEREARAISAIKHPNVVGVHEFGRLVDGRPFIVMELLEGNSLFTELRKVGPFAPARALEVLDGICAALIATHSVGIIHRDIKASNAFLVHDGDRIRPVLLDYGLAKILEGEGPELSSSRATLGTPSAMSPEQIRSEKVTKQSDIYALGALAYHVLTGEPAFAAASRSAVLHMHLNSPRPRPSQRADVPVAFDEVIMRAMARDPRKRHPSAMDFFADFAAAERRHKASPRRTSSAVAPLGMLLGVYVDLDAPLDDLADPSEALLADIEAIGTLAERRFAEVGFEMSARRGSSMLFTKLVSRRVELAERRGLIAALDELRSTLTARERAVAGLSVRLAVDIVPGSIHPEAAIERLLEAVTIESSNPGGRPGVLATARFFAGLGPPASEICEDTARLAHDSEL